MDRTYLQVPCLAAGNLGKNAPINEDFAKLNFGFRELLG